MLSSFRHWSIDRPGITRGPDDAIWFTNDGNNAITRVGIEPRDKAASPAAYILRS